MMITQTGKLLYISENASEYLGHSMEDLLIHGDSIYDIIDKQDHPTVQAELLRGQELTSPEELSCSKPEDRIFLCRMNVSRNARRQMRFGDQKVFHPYSEQTTCSFRNANSNKTNHLDNPGDPSGGPLLRDPAQRESQRARVRCLVHSCCHAGDPRVCRPGGSPHFLQPLLQILQISYPYFFLRSYFFTIPMLSLCSHVVLQGATNIFTSVHSMDLKISQIDSK